MNRKLKFLSIILALVMLVSTCVAMCLTSSAEESLYSFTTSKTKPVVDEDALVGEFDMNDAIDSYDQTKVKALADHADLVLKLSLTPARTFVKFGFNIKKAGYYTIAFDYNRTLGAEDIATADISVDAKEREQITLPATATGERCWVLVREYFTVGDHTFTLYANENTDTAVPGTTSGKYKSAGYRDLMVYNCTYDFECIDSLPSLVGKTVVMDYFNNDASDSWNQSIVTASADGTAYALKHTFNPPRTHLQFTFNVDKEGMYALAFEYGSGVNAAQCRVCVVQVDDLGRQELEVTQSANKMFGKIQIELTKGTHTLTVYAPDNLNAKVSETDARTIQSISYYSYKGWLVEEGVGELTREEGASLRMTENAAALRFKTTFTKGYYDMIQTTYGENVQYGTLIVPSTLAFGLSTINLDELDLLSADYTLYPATLYTTDTNGYYFYGVQEVKKVSDYKTTYAAYAYVKVIVDNEETYIFSQLDHSNVRSVNDLATAILDDTKTASETGYTNEITKMDSNKAYSCYAVDLYNITKAFAPTNKK